MTAIMSTAPRPRTGPLRFLFAALITAAVTLTVRVVPLPRLYRVMRRVCAPKRRPATRDEAEAVLAAVDTATRWMPARVACLERSVAAAVLLRLRWRRATWCHGVKVRPVALHAWIQVDGESVAEPENIHATYNVLFSTDSEGSRE